jgi:hypothetical protein
MSKINMKDHINGCVLGYPVIMLIFARFLDYNKPTIITYIMALVLYLLAAFILSWYMNRIIVCSKKSFMEEEKEIFMPQNNKYNDKLNTLDMLINDMDKNSDDLDYYISNLKSIVNDPNFDIDTFTDEYIIRKYGDERASRS